MRVIEIVIVLAILIGIGVAVYTAVTQIRSRNARYKVGESMHGGYAICYLYSGTNREEFGRLPFTDTNFETEWAQMLSDARARAASLNVNRRSIRAANDYEGK